MKVLGRPPLRQRRRRAWRRIVTVLALMLLVAAGAVVFYGRDIATHAITVALQQAGVPPDRIEIRRLGLTEIELGPVQLGGASGPSVTGIAAGWSLASLLGGRLSVVRVEGLRAQARIDNGALVIDGVPRGEGGGAGTVALPVDRVEIVNAQIGVTAGDIKAVVAAEATLTGSASDIQGAATADIRVTGAGPDAIHAIAKLPQLRVQPRDTGMTLAVSQASVALPDYSAELSAIDAAASVGAATNFKLTAEAHDRAAAPRVAPLLIAAEGTQEKDALKATGNIASRDKALDLKLKGHHALDSQKGTLEFELVPLRFEAEGRQPVDLFPILGKPVQNVVGQLSARGQIGWGGALTSKADIVIDNVGFQSAVTKVSDIDGKLAFNSLLPPRTAGVQHMTAKLVVPGFPEGTADLRFALPGDNRLRIEKASFALAGGSLEVANVTIGQNQPVLGELAIRSLDLAAILDVLNVDGLSGTGIIDGRIPVRVDDAGVAILAGRLGNKGPGVVRYTGAALPDTGGGPNDSVRLARQALQDFQYTELTLTLERATGGDGSLLVNLKGSNPAVLQNHPFVFNIKLETNFDKLATILLSGYAAAEGLMRSAIRP
jgi:hypothetical protein